MNRPYALILDTLRPEGDPDRRMQQVVDLLWEHLHATGVSWVGFYLPDDKGQLVLGPRRDRPACSPIGLHGACGQVFRSGRPLVVRDVADLGPNYIACDPRERSEVVLPLLTATGECRGVLDLDSHEVESFDESDVKHLQAVLQRAGLSA